MNAATLAKPVTLTSQSTLPLQPQSRQLMDLKQAHLQAGLDPHDLHYLDAPPPTVSRKGHTFRGVSIE